MNPSPIALRFLEATPPNPVTKRASTEHYAMVETASGQLVGTIRLRLSNNDDIRLYAGHIGYGVDEAHRGHGYAALACLALRPIAKQHSYTELVITCNPDNWPSRRTCERIGAEFIGIVDLPEDNDMYVLKGERQKCLYRWQL